MHGFSSKGQLLAVGEAHYGDGGRVMVYQYNDLLDLWEQVGEALNGQTTEDVFRYDYSLSGGWLYFGHGR